MWRLNDLSLPTAYHLFQRRRLDANCLVGDLVGNCVHISGDIISDRIQVTTVDVTDYYKMPAMGVIIEKSSPTVCVVQWTGEVDLSPFSPGRVLFVGSSGELTQVPPVLGPGNSWYIQSMGVALGISKILLSPNFNLTKRVG